MHAVPPSPSSSLAVHHVGGSLVHFERANTSGAHFGMLSVAISTNLWAPVFWLSSVFNHSDSLNVG